VPGIEVGGRRTKQSTDCPWDKLEAIVVEGVTFRIKFHVSHAWIDGHIK
jgi:hypothetical protein